MILQLCWCRERTQTNDFGKGMEKAFG
jgi:hypothetical protein